MVSGTRSGCLTPLPFVNFQSSKKAQMIGPLSGGVLLQTPLRSLTDRPSLPPSSFTRSPIGSPYDSLSLAGGLRAYHVALLKPRGLGPASTPVARRLRRASSERPVLATYLLVQAYQHLWLVLGDDAYEGSPGLTLPRAAGPRPPWCWQSRRRLTLSPPSRGMRIR